MDCGSAGKSASLISGRRWLMVNEKKKTVAVVGGGPGGYGAAFLASDLGLDVTMIDPEPNPGGVCLYRGCIPSKVLLHIVKIIRTAREADEFGLKYDEPKMDIDKMRSAKNKVVEQLTDGMGMLGKRRKIEYLRGKARFLDSNTLQIDLHEGKEEKKSFDHVILSTGSEAASLPNINNESERVWNSEDALNLKKVPKSLLVVGGGYIGLELGTVYSLLGSKVTIVEMMPNIMPGLDKDLVSI
ncbi:NAD(P)-binding protein, partial [candidate division KSB1 bacterium]|nr:NAD(P)-binding protein [candidate division KSB1 bacterium]